MLSNLTCYPGRQISKDKFLAPLLKRCPLPSQLLRKSQVSLLLGRQIVGVAATLG